MIWKKIHICYHPCWLYLNLSVLCDIYCEGSRNAHSMQNTGTTWYSYTDNDILCLVNLFLPSSKSNIQFCLFDHYRAPRWLLKKIIYDRHWFSLLNGSEQLRTYDSIQRAFFVCLLLLVPQLHYVGFFYMKIVVEMQLLGIPCELNDTHILHVAS